jgi:hypothetical protein
MDQLFATDIAILHDALDCAKEADLQSKTGRAMRPAAPTPPRRGILRRTEAGPPYHFSNR